MLWTYLVLTISTGMEAAVVTSPLIILAQKWQRISSPKYPEKPQTQNNKSIISNISVDKQKQWSQCNITVILIFAQLEYILTSADTFRLLISCNRHWVFFSLSFVGTWRWLLAKLTTWNDKWLRSDNVLTCIQQSLLGLGVGSKLSSVYHHSPSHGRYTALKHTQSQISLRTF